MSRCIIYYTIITTHYLQSIVSALPSSHRWRLLAEAENSGVTQTERGDSGVFTQGGLVVAVPADAVMAVPIQVAQQGVEGASSVLLHCLTKG